MLILMSRIECIFLKKIFWATCQSIQLIINLVKMISDAIVKSRQKLTSMSLMMTQLLNWHEILKIFIICDHLDRINKVFKLWSSFLESANNDHKFFIVDLIVTLDWVMLLQKVSDWMKNLCYECAQSSTETRVLEANLDSIESSAFLSSVNIVFASR